jgi:hypothetical protein
LAISRTRAALQLRHRCDSVLPLPPNAHPFHVCRVSQPFPTPLHPFPLVKAPIFFYPAMLAIPTFRERPATYDGASTVELLLYCFAN